MRAYLKRRFYAWLMKKRGRTDTLGKLEWKLYRLDGSYTGFYWETIRGCTRQANCRCSACQYRRLMTGEFVDLGPLRHDGSSRPSYERWPNGAPT